MPYAVTVAAGNLAGMDDTDHVASHDGVSVPMPKRTPIDLRGLFRQLGAPVRRRLPVADPRMRAMWAGPVVGALDPVEEVTECELPPVLFADGCQSQVLLQWRSDADGRRPVTLCWAGAAAWVGPSTKPQVSTERMWLGCSYRDEDWLRGVPTGLPVIASEFRFGGDVQKDLGRILRRVRSELEVHVVAEADPGAGGIVLADGGLLAHRVRPGTVGVVKTHRTRYVADERPLVRLAVGSRTAVFRLPGRTRTEQDRWSAYVRLNAPESGEAVRGLVRLEAWDPGLIDPAAAVAVRTRQGPGSDDPRWDRHLKGIRTVERLLKSMDPLRFFT